MRKSTVSVLAVLVGGAIGAASGVAVNKQASEKEVNKWKELAEKHLLLMQLFNQWMITKQEGKSLVEYFNRENIKSIAIYGMSYVGERVYDELKNSDIEVKYAIDRNADEIYSDIEVITPDDELEEVDAIVVTAISYYEEIEKMLSGKTSAKILSFEDILYEL